MNTSAATAIISPGPVISPTDVHRSIDPFAQSFRPSLQANIRRVRLDR